MSKTDKVPLNAAFHSHNSHGNADHNGHCYSDVARDGAPKKNYSTKFHGGMHRVSKTGANVLPHQADALDSLSGLTVVPGNIRSAPGWGNSGTQAGHPLAKPPASKNLKPIATTPGMRSRTQPHSTELGEAILRQAFQNSASDDAMAHARHKASGAKLPLSVNEK